MKRFHVHLHVDDLAANIAFYNKLFAAGPSRIAADYARWMFADPRLNFAISARGGRPGIDHLGIQTDTAPELAELKARVHVAELPLLDEGQTSCCYACSDKHWLIEPQGIAWEHFHTLAEIPVFREAPETATAPAACCASAPRGKASGSAFKSASSCC